MTDQQLLTYRTWLHEGVARFEPIPERPGWWWLLGEHGNRVRALGPRDVKHLTDTVKEKQ